MTNDIVNSLTEVYVKETGDYEWSIVALFRNDREEWLVGHDNGCSCYGAWEDWDEEDFQRFSPCDYPGATQRAIYELHRMSRYGHPFDVTSEISRLMQNVHRHIWG